MPGKMYLRFWDVSHGACAMLHHQVGDVAGRLAMIDSGDTDDWSPADYITQNLRRKRLDYLFITNADQDHMSGLQDLWDADIHVGVLAKNPSFNADAFEAVKRLSGPLTPDALRYKECLTGFNGQVTDPFNDYMGGITRELFWNQYPEFDDTNNLSLVVFIQYQGVGFLFPGDLERPGWQKHLEDPAFRAMLGKVDILCASHHGRRSGYCEDVFEHCRPQAIVISDKSIVHDTQNMTPTYRNHVIRNHSDGVYVRSSQRRRHVLTTRRDGWIQFEVGDDGFTIDTEYQG
jgi:beta-lactamase superfamily II metal-dependent hydrolase